MVTHYQKNGPNIEHISGFDKIVAYTISRLPYTSVYKYDPSISKAYCFANELFAIVRGGGEDFPLLNILNVKIEQQK